MWRRQRSSQIAAGQSQSLKERANCRGDQAEGGQTGPMVKVRSLQKHPNQSRKLTLGPLRH